MTSALRAPLLALAPLALAHGCAPEAPHVRLAQALRDARPAPDAHAIVAVHDLLAGGFCTGVLVAPRVVLTAGHCVRRPDADAPAAPSELRVTFGPTAGDPSDGVAVTSVRTALGRYSLRGAGAYELVGRDVAALTLERASDVPPLALRRDAPRDLAGSMVTLYGYGDAPDAPRGERRRAEARVEAVDAELAFVLDRTCEGDSGGPLVQRDGRVVGVASFNGGRCGEGYGAYALLAPHLALVDEALRATGAPSTDPPDASAAPDASPDAASPPDIINAAPPDAATAQPATGCDAGPLHRRAGAPPVAVCALVLAACAPRRRARVSARTG